MRDKSFKTCFAPVVTIPENKEGTVILMTNISENIKRVRGQIEDSAARSGRTGEDIKLVAAAKMNGAENVREAIACGVDAVGENRVQEMLEKVLQGAYVGAPLHFIGHLQTNKVKSVVGTCELIESVGSVKLLGEIDRHAVAAGIKQDILIEVNVGSEPGKSGVLVEELDALLCSCAEKSGIFVRGLMAIPPFLPEKGVNRTFFDMMRKLFVDIQGKKYDNVYMQYLSMGMSDSFCDAIECGANMVRVGSAIFGARAVH